MKIAYISNSLIPSTTANSIQVMENCQAFARNGHTLTLFAPKTVLTPKETVCDDKKAHEFYGVEKNFEIKKVLSLRCGFKPLSRILSVVYGAICGAHAREIAPDVLYGRFPIGLYFGSSNNLPVIFEVHGPDHFKNPITLAMIKSMIKKGRLKYIVTVSEGLKDLIEPYIPGTMIIVAPNGATDPELCDLDKTKEQYFSSPGIKVGYTGNLYPGKGVEIITRLASVMKNIQFHLFGGSKEDIESLKKDSPSNMIFHGFVKHGVMPSVLANLDILLLPILKHVSKAGGEKETGSASGYVSPLKMFEFMASGKPIVASDVAVIREILHNNRNALLCKPEEIDEWRKAIDLLINDPKTSKKLGDNARNDFKKKYTRLARTRKVLEPLKAS